jgi:hypothetical protein
MPTIFCQLYTVHGTGTLPKIFCKLSFISVLPINIATSGNFRLEFIFNSDDTVLINIPNARLQYLSQHRKKRKPFIC